MVLLLVNHVVQQLRMSTFQLQIQSQAMKLHVHQQPELYGLLRSIRVDLYMWDMAGARGISQLLALQPPS